MRLVPDTLIAGRYRVRVRLAGGGMGEVWTADDERLGRAVAVKVIRPELAEDAHFLARFRAEARAAAGLSHPGVVAVHDYGDGEEGAFLVMELVRGESLAERLGRLGTLAPDAVLDLLAQAGEALQAAHDAGVVHRDVKPANLLLREDGRVQVTDFGTARALGAATLTQPGALVGTPQYLAPEQATGEPATAAGDVFALGVVAFEALAGRRPFDGDTVPAVVAALLHADAAPLPAGLPPGVAALVTDCLARDPARRPAAARTVAARARALRAPDTPADGEPPPPPPPARDDPAPTPHTVPLPPAAARPPAPTSATPRTARLPAANAAGAPRRSRRPLLAGVLLAGAVALVVAATLLLEGDGDDPGTAGTPASTPTATATASPAETPTPTATPSPSPSSTPTAAAPGGPAASAFVGDPAASVVRRLRARGYDVTLSFSASTTGSPAPGTVYALDPDPLPRSGRVRVIAQPTG